MAQAQTTNDVLYVGDRENCGRRSFCCCQCRPSHFHCSTVAFVMLAVMMAVALSLFNSCLRHVGRHDGRHAFIVQQLPPSCWPSGWPS